MRPTPSRPGPSALDLALLRGAIEEVPFGIATTRDGRIVHANVALEQLFGAPPGGLDGAPVERFLAAEGVRGVRARLDEGHAFDGRLEGRAVDGRPLDLEVHVERYRSAEDEGGFLVVRDVTPEASALGRLVAQLGGALFRVALPGSLESVTPNIEALVGIDAASLRRSPALLVERVSHAERERVGAMLRRFERGEATQAAAEVRVRRGPDDDAVLQIIATARRDLGGRVHYVDGVVIDVSTSFAARRAAASLDAARSLLDDARTRSAHPSTDRPPGPGAGPVPSGLVQLGREVLRDATLALASVAAQATAMRSAVHEAAGSVAPEVARELGRGLTGIAEATASSARLTRHVRGAVGASIPARVRVGDLLAELGGLMAPLVAGRLVVRPGDADDALVRLPADRFLVVLLALAARTWRASGGGVVRIAAHLDASPRTVGPDAPDEVVVDIMGEVLAGTDVEPYDRDGTVDAEGDANAPVSGISPFEHDAQIRDALDETLGTIGAVLDPETWETGWARASVRIPLASG